MSNSTLTIVFRGLMALNRQPEYVEIGVLPAPGHFPRISTIQNGVLATTFDLQNPNLNPIDPQHPIWRLEVNQPVSGLSFRTSEGDFKRQEHADESDLRWISDLESHEFYDDELTTKLDTEQLLPVVRIVNGSFYTRLKTPPLIRSKGDNEPEDFGSIAGVTGCDIALQGRGARLVEDGTNRVMFAFENKPNTIYEFANTPPDIVPVGSVHHHHVQDPDDHFQLYYTLFHNLDGIEKFGFRQSPADEVSGPGLSPPAPSPALCGLIKFGRRSSPFRAGS